MTNDQQELELLLSVQQTLPLHKIDLPWSGTQIRRLGGNRLLTGALLLLLMLVSWTCAPIATPQANHAVIATHTTPWVEQPLFTVHATPTPQAAQVVAQVDSLLTNEVNHQQFSGSVLIARDDQVILSKGYGMANWQNQVPNTPHTKFYLGSTTKQFTAMAILILQEQGKLHVSDHLCSYIAQCPSTWQPVTIHNVLTHTSGIPQIDDSALSGESPEAWIASYDGVPLAFAPGSQYDYCSVCYQILGYVIEQVSGEPYSTFLQQAIFDPLQMKNSGFDPNYLSDPDDSVGYAIWQVDADSLDWPLDPRWTFLYGSGLLQSTVEDMYRWDQALYMHTLVSQQTLDEAFTPYHVAQYPGSSYGYGWFIAKSPVPEHRLIWHDGRIDGFRTYIGRYIDDHVTIIFLSNLATVDELALANTLGQIVFERT